MKKILFTLLLLSGSALRADVVETEGEIVIGGKPLSYKATTGVIPLENDKQETKAKVFFVAYTVASEKSRPVTFVTNGGPGAAAVWLHLGFCGPYRIDLEERSLPPYSLKENPYSLLDVTDLVFIDPVSTGYSRAEGEAEGAQFHGVKEDAAHMGECIRLYCTKYQRWDDPKFFMGASYGGTRAVSVAKHLQDEVNILFNGLILLAPALDYQTFVFGFGDDLPAALFLPTYAATALAHDRGPEAAEETPLEEYLNKIEGWALEEFLPALAQGSRLSQERKRDLEAMVAKISGLSHDVVEETGLRISPTLFRQELLGKEEKIIGRFDARTSGERVRGTTGSLPYDPSIEALFAPFTAAFQQYVVAKLNFHSTNPYNVLTRIHSWNWDYAEGSNGRGGSLSLLWPLHTLLTLHPETRLFVAAGIYDLAIPFASVRYALSHLEIPLRTQDSLTYREYPAGHMMYLDQRVIGPLSQDVRAFIKEAVGAPKSLTYTGKNQTLR